MHVTRYILHTIHGSISQLQAHQAACWSCPVVAPFWTGYSPNILQQESCEIDNLSTQLPPISYFSQISLPGLSGRYILRMWRVWILNSSHLCDLYLNSSCLCSHLCNHPVKISLADTLLLSCIARERLGQWSVVALIGSLVPAQQEERTPVVSVHTYKEISQFTLMLLLLMLLNCGTASWQAHQCHCS